MRRGRIVLVGPATADAPAGAIGAAARNKLVGLAEAVRAAGAIPFVVTILPFPRRLAHRRGAGYVALPVAGRRALRRLVGGVALAAFALRRLHARDRVILYNAFPEYLLLALLLRLRGTPATLDVEDAPTGARSPRERIQRLVYRLLAGLTRPQKIVASRALAVGLGLQGVLPLYGVAPAAAPVRRFAGGDLLVQFGGSLLPQTGLDLFRGAVALIERDAPASRLRFVVTGAAPDGALAGLPSRVTLAAGLDADAYAALLDTVDVALSLKLPSSEMGQTTFPSKTIEIAAAGILLVATAVSDVPLLFDETCAVILAGEEPRELADALLAAERDRAGAARRAAAGRARIAARAAPRAVGEALIAFVA